VRDVWRVVGVPLPEKGKRRFFLCNDDGRLPVVRLNREASPPNEQFDALCRGDLVVLRGASAKGDGIRVGRETQVRRLEHVPREDAG
jgi:hypothetical protein